MPFPAGPSRYYSTDSMGKFLINDSSGLRRSVIPLLTYNSFPESVQGWGTGFRIDPFGTVATAYHVVEDFIENPEPKSGNAYFRNDCGLFGFESPGLVYGRVGIGSKHWSYVKDGFTYVRLANDKFVDRPMCNICETALLKMPPHNGKSIKTVQVHINYYPRVGERLLAVGFPHLNVTGPAQINNVVNISEAMYGSFGIVEEIRQANPDSGRPWPTLIINADWPPGMSGGPVFNASGHVIGLVSTGMTSAYSTAVWFGGWNLHQQLMSQLDPLNPGMLQGWGIIDEKKKLRVFHAGLPERIIQRAIDLGMDKIARVSWEYGTENMHWHYKAISS